MQYLFFPFLLIAILTQKKFFIVLAVVTLGLMILGPLLEGLGEVFGGAKEAVEESEGLMTAIKWTLIGLGGICIYFLMYS